MRDYKLCDVVKQLKTKQVCLCIRTPLSMRLRKTSLVLGHHFRQDSKIATDIPAVVIFSSETSTFVGTVR